MAGVATANVNLATGMADIGYSDPAKVDDIKRATAKAGYPAATENLSLHFEGGPARPASAV